MVASPQFTQLSADFSELSDFPDHGVNMTKQQLLVTLAVLAGEVLAVDRASASPFTVDISKREESRVFYDTVYRAADAVPIEWTGNLASCTPGTVSAAYLDAVRERINYFRALAGVPSDITFTDEFNRLAQAMALGVSANNELNHTPPTTWKCYSDDVAKGASSNLMKGAAGPSAIDGLVHDSADPKQPKEAANQVGHRRWILYPVQSTMGSGNVPDGGPGKPAAGTNYVFGGRRPQRPAVRDNFVAWPPNGFVPYQFVPVNWSFSLDGADFSKATVAMTRGGVAVPVEVVVRAQVSNGQGGFGESSVVWIVNNLAPDFSWAKPDADEVYDVTVANVTFGGTEQSFSYKVSIFDPAKPGADYVAPTITGPDQSTVSQTVELNIAAVPAATGYQWRSRKLTPAPLKDGADDGLGQWVVQKTGDYSVINTSFDGQPVFRLDAQSLQEQSLTFPRTLQASADSRIAFRSRQRVTTNLVARVEISTDAGSTWTAAFTEAGSMNSDWSDKKAELGAFAGQPLLLRFSLRYPSDGSSVFSGSEIGWFIDDITFVDMRAAADAVVSPVIAGPTFQLTSSEVAEYDLDAQPQYSQRFLLGEWGPKKRVTFTAATVPPAPTQPPVPTEPPAPTQPPPLPMITSQPSAGGHEVSVGGTVTLIIGASGPEPLSYAWSRDGVELSDNASVRGTHESTLQLLDVQPQQAGVYTVRVSIRDNGIVSAPMTVIVLAPTPPVTL
jgi:hypothetical protein